MTWTRRIAGPLAAGLLVMLLLGPSGVTATEPRLVTSAILVPAAAFISADHDISNAGFALTPAGGEVAGAMAPLSFPVSEVSIRKITVYAYDSNEAADVVVSLLRSYPAGDPINPVLQGWVATAGAAPTQPQSLSTTDIHPRRVNTAIHGSWLEVSVAPSTHLYAVKVLYSFQMDG